MKNEKQREARKVYENKVIKAASIRGEAIRKAKEEFEKTVAEAKKEFDKTK